MRKSYLFIAAGAAVFLCGCPTTKITGNKTVIPAPMEDPVSVAPAVETAPGAAEWQAPEVKKEEKTVAQSEFKPMTGVTSSGGIESTGAKSSKKTVKGGKAAAAGGVYVVQSGDTPERIARKLRVRLSALMAANNLDQQSARRLQIGQKLVIPGKTTAPKSEDVVPPVENKTADQVVTETQVPVTETTEVKVENTETVTTTTDVTAQPATTVDAVDTDSDDQVIEITEATTAAELAKKYNVSADVISQKNSGKTEFPKGELIFVPKK